MTLKESITKLQLEICSKVMRSGYYFNLDPQLDLRVDEEDIIEDVRRLRSMQDLELDKELNKW